MSLNIGWSGDVRGEEGVVTLILFYNQKREPRGYIDTCFLWLAERTQLKHTYERQDAVHTLFAQRVLI